MNATIYYEFPHAVSNWRGLIVANVHLAQINIGRLKAPLDDPSMFGFVSRLDDINALADRTPGFVWRLQTDEGNATSLRPFDDDRIALNMSVWESLEALRAYVYSSAHAEVMRGRRDWFDKFDRVYLALWWIPAGHIPSIDEAKVRLASLEQRGPTPFVFTFKTTFTPEQALESIA
jgi:heme-degrading monooxygenase HmoA